MDSFEHEVRKRAGYRCEYCQVLEGATKLGHVLDHVIAKQHGGKTTLDNLALACGRCNRFKGPNIAGLDPLTGLLTPLFNPRRDLWSDHFDRQGPLILGKTPVGRATVAVLSINLPIRVATRRALMEENNLPPTA